MTTALLLVDLQRDFLSRPNLLPEFEQIEERLITLLKHARKNHIPVFHIRTLIEPDGSNRMPHWKSQNIWDCVAGTTGAEPPESLIETPDETIINKSFFSAFAGTKLSTHLKHLSVKEVWIAGLYTHACIRATTLDAYQFGYKTTIVSDGIASTEPLHAKISNDYMQGRSARYSTVEELTGTSQPGHAGHNTKATTPPPPSQFHSQVDISDAINNAKAASIEWMQVSQKERRTVIQRLRQMLDKNSAYITEAIVKAIGKPISDAREEIRRTLTHLDATLELSNEYRMASDTRVIYRPLGLVGLISPWNNPVAIPVAKIAAAIQLGNAVVWKPAIQVAPLSEFLNGLFVQAGLPPNVIQTVQGGPNLAIAIAENPHVDAVSLTGPELAGRTIEAICRSRGIPLQAELGGNNALLVLKDALISELAPFWAQWAFGFAGQRCTAIRRFIVEEAVAETFENAMCSAIQELKVNDPQNEDCDVGPLISAAKLVQVQDTVTAALGRGARMIVKSDIPQTIGHGNYYPPTLLTELSTDDPLVQEELFGPVAVVQYAKDFDHGIKLLNNVRQGLLAGIATESDEARREFSARAKVGILVYGRGLSIHPAAPFGGAKASQIGPPEHGIWDRQFFTVPQVIYETEP